MNKSQRRVKVTLGGKVYIVEVGDLKGTPIVVTVNGKRYEAYIDESGDKVERIKEAPGHKAVESFSRMNPKTPSVPVSVLANKITAPLPGDVVEIFVKGGDRVAVGQAVCVLEAMKMKNTIRSPQDGTIARVEVSIGESVAYGTVLVSFE